MERLGKRSWHPYRPLLCRETDRRSFDRPSRGGLDHDRFAVSLLRAPAGEPRVGDRGGEPSGRSRPDGGFTWLKCGWPPYEHDDYYGAVFAALGVGLAPEGYARTAMATEGLEELRRYLHDHPAPDLHHRTFLLWASLRLDGLMTPEE